jgi:hypothetical protein
MEQHELFDAVRKHYAARDCALVTISWGDPPQVDIFIKPGDPLPPLPDCLPANTVVKTHEPKRVQPWMPH